MKRLLIILIALFYSNILAAQDTIIKMNTTRIVAKVLEINTRDVKFKKTNNPDGPLYILDKRQISRIKYANGTVDTISAKKVYAIPDKVKSDPRVKDYGRNYFSATISDVFFGFATIGYERILKTGKFGIKLPLSIGFNEPHISSFNGSSPYQYHYSDGWDQTGYYSTNKIFSTGLDLYYYTGGQGTLRYFIGPCIEFGQFYYKYYETINTQPVSYTVKKEIGSYGALIFKNGMLFQPTKSFNVSLTIGAGFYQEQTKYDNSNVNSFYDIEDLFAVEFGLHAGYKF